MNEAELTKGLIFFGGYLLGAIAFWAIDAIDRGQTDSRKPD